MWPSKGTLKYGHIRQVVAKYRYNWYKMFCEGKLKLRSQNVSYYLIEVVVTKASLTVYILGLVFFFILRYQFLFIWSNVFSPHFYLCFIIILLLRTQDTYIGEDVCQCYKKRRRADHRFDRHFAIIMKLFIFRKIKIVFS